MLLLLFMNVYRRITNKVEGKCSEYIHIYIGHDVVQYGCLESENDETT
jgi:hypothetical protein